MNITHTIQGCAVHVIITDTTADNILREITNRYHADAVGLRDHREKIEEIAHDYLRIERPVVTYWHNDEIQPVDTLKVTLLCGHIFEHYEFIGELDMFRYAKAGEEVGV